MNFKNLKLPSVSKKKVSLNSFLTKGNLASNESVSDFSEVALSFNFDLSDGTLKSGIGISEYKPNNNSLDLGKDVAPEVIVEKCKSEKIQLVGLSALMTTTVAAMEETIVLLRKECPWAKVCVGGAVMTQEYANQIGADFYGKDAMDTVRYANNLFTK